MGYSLKNGAKIMYLQKESRPYLRAAPEFNFKPYKALV